MFGLIGDVISGAVKVARGIGGAVYYGGCVFCNCIGNGLCTAWKCSGIILGSVYDVACAVCGNIVKGVWDLIVSGGFLKFNFSFITDNIKMLLNFELGSYSKLH